MNTPTEPRKSKSKFPWKTMIVLLLLLLLLLLMLKACSPTGWGNGRTIHSPDLDSLRSADSLSRLDSLRRADSLAGAQTRRNDSLLHMGLLSRADSLRILDSLRREDSLAALRRQEALEMLRRLHPTTDTTKGRKTASDGLKKLSRLDSLRLASGDSIPPVVFADPAPGIHPAPIDVALIIMEPKAVPLCGPRPDSLRLCRDLIRVTTTAHLWVSAEDSVGNRAEPREMRWQIDPDASRCGPRRALVPVDDDHQICMDAYEYPNDPSVFPRTSVTWEDANSLCAKIGRRLCSADELKTACEGPEEWPYPYGKTFAVSYCQVVEGKIIRGVGRPACRSWWGAYNLLGNAWEWTSTPVSTPIGPTYLTSGGTFEGGPSVRCGKTSKSFFRQNSYGAVGFRCCEDLKPEGK